MRAILFVISVFVCRTHLRRMQNAAIDDERLTKIGTVVCLLLPSLSFFVNSTFAVLSSVLFFHIVMASLPKILKWMKLRKALQQRLSAITKMILHMQIGNSLRSALRVLAQNEKDDFWKRQWEATAEIVAFSPQEVRLKPEVLQKFAEDLVRCDQNSFAQLEQLSEIRAVYQKEFDFRRRSGQSLLQLRLQAVILFGLHLAVTAFMIHQFSWSAHKLIYLTSFLLMSLGLCALLFIGQGVKWKT